MNGWVAIKSCSQNFTIGSQILRLSFSMMILRHMQTAKCWHFVDNERGTKLTIFPTNGREGEREERDKSWTSLKMKQISLTLTSDYSVVKIPITTGLDNYPGS